MENTLQIIHVALTAEGLTAKLEDIQEPGGAPSTPAKEAGEPASSITSIGVQKGGNHPHPPGNLTPEKRGPNEWAAEGCA